MYSGLAPLVTVGYLQAKEFATNVIEPESFSLSFFSLYLMGLGTEAEAPAKGVGTPIRLTFCATLGLWTLEARLVCTWCKGFISTPWSEDNMWSGVWLRPALPTFWLECGDPFMYCGLNFPCWKVELNLFAKTRKELHSVWKLSEKLLIFIML